jgi:hypothetical protein
MINKNSPNTVYTQLSCWVNLKELIDLFEYKSIVKKKEKEIKTLLYQNINENLIDKNKFIVDFNLASSGVMNNKSSYMLCDITFYLKNKNKLKKKCDVNIELERLTKILINNVFNENDSYFSYSLK